MPRRKSAVKRKVLARSIGAVDIHFHGAFGIDLMKCESSEMDRLSGLLWENGVAAFCPTTLSMPFVDLKNAVSRIGNWIKSGSAPGALPLGIHLEGPYIDPGACGAHPAHAIRKFDLGEIEELQQASQNTLKILTIAPEKLDSSELKNLAAWAKKNHVALSLGHSKATEEQAKIAFENGFSGITHAWNALPFHHRAPGPLGAALGNERIHVELIIDRVHVAPTIARWTHEIHGDQVVFVSDCVPAAETESGTWHSFGELNIQYRDGACRLRDGHLAGGGKLLPKLYSEWLDHEKQVLEEPIQKLLKNSLASLTEAPLRALGISPKICAKRRVDWRLNPAGSVQAIRVDSSTRKR